MVSGAWLKTPHILGKLRAAVVAKVQEAEVRGAHLPKTAEGGATSVVIVPAIKSKWASAHPRFGNGKENRS